MQDARTVRTRACGERMQSKSSDHSQFCNGLFHGWGTSNGLAWHQDMKIDFFRDGLCKAAKCSMIHRHMHNHQKLLGLRSLFRAAHLRKLPFELQLSSACGAPFSSRPIHYFMSADCAGCLCGLCRRRRQEQAPVGFQHGPAPTAHSGL